MTIATRFPKSWAVPKFDIKDPSLVLYIPLWYPDSETTGSTIISKDSNRYSCTVTGATWGNQGRTFDGIASTIPIGVATDMQFSTAFTAGFWMKLDPSTDAVMPFGKHNSTTDGWGFFQSSEAAHKMTFYLNLVVSGRVPITSVTSVDNSLFHHIFATYDSISIKLYIDGVSDTAPVADTNALVSPQTRITRLGRRSEQSTNWFVGTIGECLLYNRALSASEIRNLYLTTKWRY